MKKLPYVLSAVIGLLSIGGQIISTVILDKQTERIGKDVENTYRKFNDLVVSSSTEDEEQEDEE